MAESSYEDFKIRCNVIDEQLYRYFHELIIERLPEEEHHAAVMYVLTRIVTKTIRGIYPQKNKQPEIVDAFCKTVKQLLEYTKEATVQ